jgi:hypothetical protein
MTRGGCGLAPGPHGVDMVFAFWERGRRGRDSSAALPVPRVSDVDVVLSRVELGWREAGALYYDLGWIALDGRALYSYWSIYWAGPSLSVTKSILSITRSYFLGPVYLL